ncbi:DUF2341 domain-containing protein, partial [Mangrovimonas futianensis]|uniref:DUF2341 domain-containing protein n=1 Tax=Mangrovimonas futianensis TaxID=2895523 RepID=UPI001E3C442D
LTIQNFQPSYQSHMYLQYTYFPGMKADFSDIRFYDGGTGEELPYWIEKMTSSFSADVWIKTGATNKVSMYYGNPSATSSSSATAVFDFFDDFSDGT